MSHLSRSAANIARNLASDRKPSPEDLALERRLSLLKKTGGVEPGYIARYKETDVIRQAVRGVKQTADVHEATRANPRKVYSGAKSKVAGNIRSVNRANARKWYGYPGEPGVRHGDGTVSATQLEAVDQLRSQSKKLDELLKSAQYHPITV